MAKYRKYSKEFKLQAARLVTEQGYSYAQAAAHSYFESNRIYGYRKVFKDLQEDNVICCEETVRRIMRRIGLYSRIKRRFIVTTDSNHTLKIAENLLNREFTARKPNQKWAADITYIPTKMGWLYLAVVMDLFSRRIVGWSMSGSKAKYMRVLRMAKKIFSITLRCSIIVNVGIKHWAM